MTNANALLDALVDRIAEAVAQRIAVPAPPPDGPAWLNTKEAAAYLGCSTQTLEIQRTHGGGPKYHKAGNRVRYRRTDLDAHMGAARSNTGETQRKKGRR